MAQTYNFETRELCPFRENWHINGGIAVGGALWYIKELNGIYLINNPRTRPSSDTVSKLVSEVMIAQGFPAALLAQGNLLTDYDFNAHLFFDKYCNVMGPLFPQRPVNYIPFVLQDWELSLRNILPFGNSFDGYCDHYSLMKVGIILRDMLNPFSIIDNKAKISTNYQYACQFKGVKEPQLLSTYMPNIKDRQAAPIVISRGISQPKENSKIQFDGFAAAVFNMAIIYAWEEVWRNYNFTDVAVIEKINKAVKDHTPIIEISELSSLSFNLPISVENLCKLYIDAFLPIMRNVWEHRPDVQLACIDEDNIYTYIYACEQSSLEGLYNSELFANMTDDQKLAIFSYSRRFSEWMVKTYSITMESQKRIMDAIGRDIPPIQLMIKNDVRITRAKEEQEERLHKRKETAFAKLIIEDKEAILKILHKRIDGRKGKDIGVVLAAATYKYHLLTRTPTEVEFRGEFDNIQKCSWRSISEWLKKPGKAGDLRPDINEVILDI